MQTMFPITYKKREETISNFRNGEETVRKQKTKAEFQPKKLEQLQIDKKPQKTQSPISCHEADKEWQSAQNNELSI